jgi:importin subunit alpha-6/7
MFSSSARNARRGEYKKGLDSDDARRRRADSTVELRKNKRLEQFAKRRMRTDGQTERANNFGTSASNSAPLPSNAKATIENLPQHVAGLSNPDEAARLTHTRAIRKLLSIEANPPIQQVIDSGAVPVLVRMLGTIRNFDILFEAAWAVTNIASGTSAHTHEVVKNNGVEAFVRLLGCPNVDVQEQAVWALGNIAGDSHKCRDHVLKCGALRPLLQLCNPTNKISLARNATWCMSNLCRGKPQPDFSLVSEAVPFLAKLVCVDDEEILTDACWALSYVSDDNGPKNEKIAAVVSSGVIPRLIQLLSHSHAGIKTPALRTLGNCVTGSDTQTQAVLDAHILPHLIKLLKQPGKGIRKETCWALSNIMAGTSPQIQQALNINVMPALVGMLSAAEFEIKREAAWAISNATSGGNKNQIRTIAAQGTLAGLCSLLSIHDAKVVMIALEGMENILRVGQFDANQGTGINQYREQIESCGGIDALEALENHDNDDVYDKVVKILREYFDAEEEDEDESGLGPQDQGNTFGFGFGGSTEPSSNNKMEGGFNSGSNWGSDNSFGGGFGQPQPAQGNQPADFFSF